MNNSLLEKHLFFARSLLQKTDQLINKQLIQKALRMNLKEDGSWVTNLDKEIESYMRNHIHTAYPSHGIIGEEYANKESEHELCWILDPIDGTESLIAGIPFFTTMLALQEKNQPILSVISAPAMKQTVWASYNNGCYCNGSPCRVRRQRNLRSSWFISSDPGRLQRLYPMLAESIAHNIPIYRTWADAYGYLLLAFGKVDIVIDFEMQIWDIIPLIPIVREAGGHISDLYGNTQNIRNDCISCSCIKLFGEFSKLAGYPHPSNNH